MYDPFCLPSTNIKHTVRSEKIDSAQPPLQKIRHHADTFINIGFLFLRNFFILFVYPLYLSVHLFLQTFIVLALCVDHLLDLI